MTLKFFLRIRIDSNQIESNPVFLSSNQIELKLERIESNRITLKFDSIRFIRNLRFITQFQVLECLGQSMALVQKLMRHFISIMLKIFTK